MKRQNVREIVCNRYLVAPASCLSVGHDAGVLFYFFVFDLRFKYHLQSLYSIHNPLPPERIQATSFLPFLGAEGGVLCSPVSSFLLPGAEPLAPRCRRNAPFKRRFGMGGWLLISMMMLVRDFYDK